MLKQNELASHDTASLTKRFLAQLLVESHVWSMSVERNQ